MHNFGGGDILEVTLGGRKGVLIPFTQAAVPQVSIAEGFVRVDPAAAGLDRETRMARLPRATTASTPRAGRAGRRTPEATGELLRLAC